MGTAALGCPVKRSLTVRGRSLILSRIHLLSSQHPSRRDLARNSKGFVAIDAIANGTEIECSPNGGELFRVFVERRRRGLRLYLRRLLCSEGPRS
jgi:hypothetical protein